jgi:hypothetical protein
MLRKYWRRKRSMRASNGAGAGQQISGISSSIRTIPTAGNLSDRQRNPRAVKQVLLMDRAILKKGVEAPAPQGNPLKDVTGHGGDSASGLADIIH